MGRNRIEDLRIRSMQMEVRQAVDGHPLVGNLLGDLVWRELPHDTAVRVVEGRWIQLNLRRRFSTAEWLWWVAHARLHLALGHPWEVRRSYEQPLPFALARCLKVNDLLFQFGIGQPPAPAGRPLVRETLPEKDPDRLVLHLQEKGIPEPWLDCGGVHAGSDLVGRPEPESEQASPWRQNYSRIACATAFAQAIRLALAESLDRAGGTEPSQRGPVAQAARWIRSYLPVIGALLDRFRLVVDQEICRRMNIRVAAVCDETAEIYLNPIQLADEEECRFVVAHELLHVGLRHGERCGGHDPLWWNAACDFMINGWLIAMGVGRPPALGGLHDPGLRNLTTEQVYDRIQATMQERHLIFFAEDGDLRSRPTGPGASLEDLDAWCRNAMLQGLDLHQAGRGTLPADLVEEIRSLAQPPLAWDVCLARWFERQFGAEPQRRSYARPSRRQSSSPDIPRPRSVPDQEDDDERTFATVIDTSGSMDRVLLGKAVGAVASYAMSREVRRVRVIFCDAAAHDAGWVAPEALLDQVEVRGRGGTFLQPGIDLLDYDQDFPVDGPILIITDGCCDRFRCRRIHAILIPAWARLPFVPQGEVFRMR